MTQTTPLNLGNLTDEQTKAKLFDLIDEAYAIRIKDVNESLRIIRNVIKQSKSINYEHGLNVANAYLAFFNMIKGNFKKALQISNLLLEKFEDPDSKSYKSLIHYTIGSVNYKSDNYHVGLDHLLRCLGLRREIGDKFGESQVLKGIGTIYECFNDYDSAVEVYNQCREISRSINDKLGESNACNPLSGIYLKQNKYEKALETAERSIELKQAAGDNRGLAFAYHAKAKVFFKKKSYQESEKWFLKCLEIQINVDEKLGIAMCQEKLGGLYFEWQKYAKAKECLNASIDIGKHINSKLILFKSYHLLYRIAKIESNPIQALKYLEKYLENKETVINTDTNSIIKSFKAISKIEMLERESRIIKEKNKTIEKKNAELDTFVYRVSHDLRGPIASLLGLYNIAKYDIEDPMAVRYLDMYHEQISRLNGIILDLINLTRIKGWQAKNVKIEFQNIIGSIIKSFKYLPNFNKIRFNVNIEENISFHSDRSIITTIFQNLIENSIKYSRVDIVPIIDVLVKLDTDKTFLLIEVRDNGIGINRDYQERVFEMFFRASEEKEGSGLGLYILKYAVDKLKGHISLKSEHGLGSSFNIKIPVKDVAESPNP